ncbi:MAG: DUF6807 family protein [Candidatus Methylacidiphilales bacterium]|nr:DUF6807 family protein [Candidatus Methylacidiphilales bacterium]
MNYQLHAAANHLEVTRDGQPVGLYHTGDPFKPHWHPLRSPAGHIVTLARPHDHLHHKGLMYVLRTSRYNFMEEANLRPGEEVGRQIHLRFEDVVSAGPAVSWTEHLEWRGGAGHEPVFREIRRQNISTAPSGGLLLAWHSSLTAVSDLSLIQSEWSRPNKDGVLINYHGLVIRLPREWCGTGNFGFAADGVPMPAADAFGTRVREATYYGAMDGPEELTFASVTLRQHQDHRLCLRDAPFAWMTMGPTNGGPLEIAAGHVFEERYEVEIRDGKPF